MGRKKAVVDSQQRTLFSCSHFSQQATRPSQQTGTALPAQTETDIRDENASRSKSRNGRPAAAARSPKKQGKLLSTDRQGSLGAQIEHAVAAISADRSRQADNVPIPTPRRHSDVIATQTPKEVEELWGKLNADQVNAAQASLSPPVFLLAGAGTGKTTTLIARVWHLLAQGVFPRNILVITFTRKACKEIQGRLKAGDDIPPVQVNSFHSWAIRFLQRRDVRELTQQQKVTVWDHKEQVAQMGDACQRAQIDYHLLPFARGLLQLPTVDDKAPLQSWAELLTAAFSHQKLQEPLKVAKERARSRVSEVIQELSGPGATEGDEDAVQSEPKDQMVEQKKVAAASAQCTALVDQMAAAPGAAKLPAAHIKHIAAKRKRNMKPPDAGAEDVESDDEDLNFSHLKDQRSADGHWVDSFFAEEESDVNTWMLVAKELLTTYLCQECGVEIVVMLGEGAEHATTPQQLADRRLMFRTYYMYHSKQQNGTSKLDKRKLKEASNAALQYRSFEKRQGAEGLAPSMFNSAANRCFEHRMKMFGAMDYDEMLSSAEHLLATNESARGLARNTHCHVLVDEFQDCNTVQVRIVSHLQRHRGQLTVVGDDAQSIYNWRGASNQAFSLLKKMLGPPCNDFKLVKNYRSRPAILKVGNMIVERDMTEGVLSSKSLECAASRARNSTAVEYHEFCSSWAEAQWVCDTIQRLHQVEKRRWEDMAIVTRAMKAFMLFPGQFGVLGHLKLELTKRGIPHRVTRGRTLSDAAEFKQSVAVLQFLANPQNDSALFALLESKLPLKKGIGDSVVTALRRAQADSAQPEACWRLLQRMASSPQLPTRKRNAIQNFLAWHSWVFRAVMFMKLPDALLFIWKESGIAAAADRAQKNKAARSQQPAGSVQPSEASPSKKCTPMISAPALSNPVAGSGRKKALAAEPQRVQVPDAAEVLVTPVLESLHRHAQEYYDEWTPEELQVDHFRCFQFEQKVMKLAADLIKLSSANQQLSDVLLSVNKLGYGPIVQFVTNLALHSGEIEEHHQGEGGSSEGEGGQGKVTLTTIHSCKGLEWPVVFAVKWQEGVLNTPYRGDSDLKAFGDDEWQLARVAMQSDARVHGEQLQTEEDILSYLPKWLEADGIQMDGSHLQGRGSQHSAPLENLPTWYKMKKCKQHREEITRLAHVAVTRAKDRLYISGHRFSETSADASNMGKFLIQTSCNIWRTPAPVSIALPADPAIMMSQVHHGGDIEEELRHRAQSLPQSGQPDFSAYRSPTQSPNKPVTNIRAVVSAEQLVHSLQNAVGQPAAPHFIRLGTAGMQHNMHAAAARAAAASNTASFSRGESVTASPELSPLHTRAAPRAMTSTSRGYGPSTSHGMQNATHSPSALSRQHTAGAQSSRGPDVMRPPGMPPPARPPVQRALFAGKKRAAAPANAPFKQPKRG